MNFEQLPSWIDFIIETKQNQEHGAGSGNLCNKNGKHEQHTNC